MNAAQSPRMKSMTNWSFAFVACMIATWYLLAEVVPSSSLLRWLVALVPAIVFIFFCRAAYVLVVNRDAHDADSEQAMKDQLAEVKQVASNNVGRLLLRTTADGKHMRAAHRKYLRAFIPAMAGYVVVLFASILLLQKIGFDAPVLLRAILALAPVVPIMFVCRALIQFLRDCDELERQIELEAIALSCLFTGLIFLCLGFLATSKLISLGSGGIVAIWVFPTLCGLYGVTKCIASRRYR